ncbi:hypothetical protein Peur_017509 [Populus x canadensis]
MSLTSMIISSSITRSPEINEIDASGSAVSDRSDHELFIRGNKCICHYTIQLVQWLTRLQIVLYYWRLITRNF